MTSSTRLMCPAESAGRTRFVCLRGRTTVAGTVAQTESVYSEVKEDGGAVESALRAAVICHQNRAWSGY